MNLKQAKTKLDTISKSTAIQHPKVLVGELCVVIKFLLDEIQRIKTPSMSVLKQHLELDPHKPIYTPPTDTPKRIDPMIPCQPPWPDKPPEIKKLKIKEIPTIHRPRTGNAGDAT